MKKTFLSLAMAAVMALTLTLSALAAAAPIIISEGIAPDADGTAYVSAQPISVNGQLVPIKMYALRNATGGTTNYVYIRDLAYVLKDTTAKFSVGYDPATHTISVNAGSDYVVTGVELVERLSGDQHYTRWADPVSINGYPTEMQAFALTNASGGDYTYYQLRDLAQAINIYVGYDPATNSVSLDTTRGYQYATQTTQPEPSPIQSDPISITNQSYALASGAVSAQVVTVDLSDDRVSIKAALVDNKLNHTADFADICAASGADVVVNANFFAAYSEVQDPIGALMVDGQFLYGASGITMVGFTADNQVSFGTPSVFYRVKTVDDGAYQNWVAYGVNEGSRKDAVLYTPARGDAVTAPDNGKILTVVNDVTTACTAVSAGDSIAIPANGFVLFQNTAESSTAWYQEPQMGRRVTIEPYHFNAAESAFPLAEVQTIVSGGRLVKEGAMTTTLEAAFATDARFTQNSAPRTAIGRTKTGKLVLVSAATATIPQMRELMVQLGCDEAVNLDGGASTALYYRGQTLVHAGRRLTSTLQIFVEK